MLKKQKKLIIILGIAAVILILGYFLVVNPLIAKLTAKEEEIPELLPGEVLGINNRILMFEHCEKATIDTIEVHNDYGTYTFYRGDDDEFYILGNEGAPYDKTALSSLVTSAGYTLSMKRVTTECTDWSEYGLDDASDPAWYRLTTIDGSEHIVYIGDMIPTGAAYYVRYKDRDAVYVLEASLQSTLLAPVTNLITPILAYPLGTTDYFTVHDFYIMHHDEYKIWVDYIEDGVVTEQPTTTFYEMKAPANYIPSSKYETMLQTFTQFTGSATVAIGNYQEVMTADELAPFGIDPEDPAWTIHYNYSGLDNFVYLSELQDGGYYYAYSLLFNLVAILPRDTVAFLDWELIEFVDESLYMLNINDISKIDVISDAITETFTLVGEGEEILITPQSTQQTFDATDLKNFRQVYKTYLSIKMEDYTDSTDTSELLLTLRFTTDEGKLYEFKFYPYSTRRCYYTVNGEGEFYVLRDMVEKAISDTGRVMNGEAVDSWAKN